MEQTELHERLHGLAGRSAPEVRDAHELTRSIAGAVRARRRREAALAAVAAVLVAVFVGVPTLRSGTEHDVQPAAPSTGIYSTHTRGNLAQDAELVDAVVRMPWIGSAGAQELEPALNSRHVVFAGYFPGGKWALVAGAPPGVPTPPDADADGLPDLDRLDSFAIAWFSGPSDAGAEEMTIYGEPRIVDADEPTAVLSPTEPYGSSRLSRMVVVGAPGDEVETSWFGEIAPDGEIVRTFDPAPTVDGIADVGAGQVDASIDRALHYRVVRGDTEFSGLPMTEPGPDFVPPRVDLARLRPAPPPAPGDAAVASAIDTLISHQGVWAHIFDFTVLWAGDLPAPSGDRLRVTVLAAQIYDEGVYLTGAVGRESGGQVSTGSCGSETRPADASPEDLVVVLRCGSADGSEDASTDSLVVVAPPGATTAQVWDARGERIASYPLADGVAVVPIPGNLASVSVIGADGETIDDRAPMSEVDWAG
jgi:hypothetical protein